MELKKTYKGLILGLIGFCIVSEHNAIISNRNDIPILQIARKDALSIHKRMIFAVKVCQLISAAFRYKPGMTGRNLPVLETGMAFPASSD